MKTLTNSAYNVNDCFCKENAWRGERAPYPSAAWACSAGKSPHLDTHTVQKWYCFVCILCHSRKTIHCMGSCPGLLSISCLYAYTCILLGFVVATGAALAFMKWNLPFVRQDRWEREFIKNSTFLWGKLFVPVYSHPSLISWCFGSISVILKEFFCCIIS